MGLCHCFPWWGHTGRGTPRDKEMSVWNTLPPWTGAQLSSRSSGRQRGPLTRYVKLRVVHAPGMPGTFSPPPTSKETASKRSRHASRHVRVARAVMHVGIANPRWRGKCSRYSWRMHNPQFCVSGKRPIPSAPLWLSAPYFFKRSITIWLPGC